MTAPAVAPAGVVLDQPLADALLLAAFDEGLLPGDDLVGDGFPQRLRRRVTSPALKDQAFEQVIIGAKAFIPFWVPNEWRGALTTLDIAPFEPQPQPQPQPAFGSLDPSVLFGMLAQRGQQMTLARWEELIATLNAAISRWEAIAPDHANVDVGLVLSITRATQAPSPFTDEQVAAWRAMQEAFEPLSLANRCLQDLSAVLLTSLELDALSSVPLSAVTGGSPLTMPGAADSAETTQLLRITSRQLQRLPTPETLKDTLDVARSPEAAALRVKLSDWSTRLRSGDLDAASLVADEVADARRHLATARTVGKVGDLVTIVGMPTTVAGVVAATPELAVAGIAVAAAGGLALGARTALERLGRWAMYGGTV